MTFGIICRVPDDQLGEYAREPRERWLGDTSWLWYGWPRKAYDETKVKYEIERARSYARDNWRYEIVRTG